jgi:hypothetical protein
VADNATSNDTQIQALSNNPNNGFEEVNRVRCFNHTVNLAVKALLRPFQTTRRDGTKDSLDVSDFDLPDLVDATEGNEDEDEVEEGEDEEDTEIAMTEEERALAFAQTEEVKTCLSKVTCN